MVKDFEKALLYPVEMLQPLDGIDGTDATKFFKVKQEPKLPENFYEILEFFKSYDSLYSELLNDIRIMFLRYIETKYQREPERCTPKDLVNLKMKYLFIFMIFVSNTKRNLESSDDDVDEGEDEGEGGAGGG